MARWEPRADLNPTLQSPRLPPYFRLVLAVGGRSTGKWGAWPGRSCRQAGVALPVGVEGDPVGLRLVSTAGCKLPDDVWSSGTARLSINFSYN